MANAEKMKTVTGFIFLSSKITAGSDCSHEIKRHLLLGRKPMVNRNSVQFISVAQSCLTLCDPMNCSTPGFPVHHQFLELTQTHVYRVSDAIQPSPPLLSPSPPAFNLSQHQGLFQWINSSHHVIKVIRASASASVLPMNIQDWFPLGLTKRQEVNVEQDVEKSESFMHSWWKCKLV